MPQDHILVFVPSSYPSNSSVKGRSHDQQTMMVRMRTRMSPRIKVIRKGGKRRKQLFNTYISLITRHC